MPPLLGVAVNVQYGSVVLLVNPIGEVQYDGLRCNQCQRIVLTSSKMVVGTLSGTHPWLARFRAPALLPTTHDSEL